jgi:outer membrane immunogenic protein
MKKFIALPIAVIVSVALLRIAFAGPEPISSKEMKQVAPAPLPECNWSGFYAGALIGYARGDLVWKDVDFGDNELMLDRNQSGFQGGGELGFNYQWNWLVVGIEGTFSYSDLQAHSVKGLAGGGNQFDTRSNWQGTVAGRLGFAWNHLLVFAKGGIGFVDQSYGWLQGDPENERVNTFWVNETRVGGLVGGGVEYMFNCHWSAKLEYNHIFLGTDTISGSRNDFPNAAEPESFDTSLDEDVVQFGINYRFWGFR